MRLIDADEMIKNYEDEDVMLEDGCMTSHSGIPAITSQRFQVTEEGNDGIRPSSPELH